MTTEIQQAVPPDRGPDKGLSAAKIGLIGTVITAVASLGGLWLTKDDKPDPINIGGKVIETSPFGSVGKVTTNESGSEVTVTGWAESGVDDVVVLIGPRPSDKTFWTAKAPVTGQHWDVVVKTDPKIEPGYSVTAYFNRGVHLVADFEPLNYPLPTPPPTPPALPTDITQCAALYGQACFTDPAWGPPSVYQPNA